MDAKQMTDGLRIVGELIAKGLREDSKGFLELSQAYYPLQKELLEMLRKELFPSQYE